MLLRAKQCLEEAMPFGLISSWYVIRRTKIEMELTPVFLSTFLRCFT